MSRPDGYRTIEDEAAFRTLHGEASGGAVAKSIHRVDTHARNFLARSPFVMVATFGTSGADCSPRGDAPGFVRVIDDTSLLIPDRPGNRRADTMGNILADPRVALLAMIPGMNETLRVNGRAWLVDDETLLADSTVRGKAPKVGIWIDVEEVFFHCAKAFVRSRLWDASQHMERGDFPTFGNILLDQIKAEAHAADDAEVATVDGHLDADIRDNLY
jgi:PPOX class probable FMN-dependent enzyme